MDNLKTYEEYEPLNEGIIETLDKIGKVIISPFSLMIKRVIKNKSDEEKLNIFEKLLGIVNYTLSREYMNISIYALLSFLGIHIAVTFLHKFSFMQPVYWIYLLMFWIIISSRKPFKEKVMSLVREIKDDHIRNKLSEAEKLIDPLGEEDWGDDGDDIFIRKSSALERNNYLCDIEISYKDGVTQFTDLENPYTRYVFLSLSTLILIWIGGPNIDVRVIENGKLVLKNVEIQMIDFNKNVKKIKKRMSTLRDFRNLNIRFIKK